MDAFGADPGRSSADLLIGPVNLRSGPPGRSLDRRPTVFADVGESFRTARAEPSHGVHSKFQGPIMIGPRLPRFGCEHGGICRSSTGFGLIIAGLERRGGARLVGVSPARSF